jgi:hypothetical protein
MIADRSFNSVRVSRIMLPNAVAPIGPGFCITSHTKILSALPSVRRSLTKLTRTAVIYAHAASLRDVIAAF